MTRQTESSVAIRRPVQRRLGAAFVIAAVFFAVELAGGLWSGSLALLADAAHLFADLGGLLLAYTGAALAGRRPTERHTFGLHRAEILAAFVNAEVLLVISIALFWESYRRIVAPPEVATTPMLVVAVAGLLANLVSMRILHEGHEKSLNVKAAYLEAASDAIGSLGVVVGAAIMIPTGWYWVDPLISAAIGLLILPRTLTLLRQTAHILLEGTPGDVDLTELRERLLAIPGVEELHDLHFWTLTSGMHSLSVHIRAAPDSPRGQVLGAVQKVLREDAGVDHATVQIEWGTEMICETTREHA